LLGEIDDTGVRYSEGRGIIDGFGAQQLKRLLGNGYGRKIFHMELAGVRLENCRVVSPSMVFTYQTLQRIEELGFEDDEPDTYVTLVDELADNGDDDGPDTWPEYDLSD
jgi:hypothetical protein